MSPEDYIMNNLMINAAPTGSRAFTVQRRIASECINNYKHNNYGDLHEMINQAKRKVEKYSPLVYPITAKAYAKRMNICVSTARNSF